MPTPIVDSEEDTFSTKMRSQKFQYITPRAGVKYEGKVQINQYLQLWSQFFLNKAFFEKNILAKLVIVGYINIIEFSSS